MVAFGDQTGSPAAGVPWALQLMWSQALLSLRGAGQAFLGCSGETELRLPGGHREQMGLETGSGPR